MKVLVMKSICASKYQVVIFTFLALATFVYLLLIEYFFKVFEQQLSLDRNKSIQDLPGNKNVPSEKRILASKSTQEKSLQASVYSNLSDRQIHVGKAVRNEYCHLPILNPFHKSMMRFMKNITPHNCLQAYPLLFETDLDSNLIAVNITQTAYTDCCYGEISREKGKDNEVILSQQCTPIKLKESKIPLKKEFIYVSCFNSTGKNRKIVDMFGFVNLKPEVESRLNKIPDDGKEKLNVVILGLDSISHMNFIRTNKNSHKFLTRNLSAIEFHGFTKVADNTFPNVVPLLMGLSEEEAKNTCFPKSTYFDSCPFIWKEFSLRGYRTSYTEDSPRISIFNYAKNGFLNPPTDYYMRPLLYAQDRNITSGILTYEAVCNGPRYSFDVLLDNIRKTSWSLGAKGKPYFQFVWSTALSHDWANAPSWGDRHLKKTLEWFSSTNRINDTILMIMSDHGMRWGDIRDSYQGRIEERMPLFYSVFPKWFEEKYKNAMINYKRNADKLTTPFDVHATLRDILNLRNIEDHSVVNRAKEILKLFANNSGNSRKAVRGISLFLPIPSYRDCAMAHIPSHFCVCHETRPVSIINNTEITDISHYVMKQINSLLKRYPQCFQIKVKNIIAAQIVVKTTKRITNVAAEELVVSISTEPGNAIFEATVQKTEQFMSKYSLDLSTITRTNRYGWHSKCVKDYELKKFCYCR